MEFINQTVKTETYRNKEKILNQNQRIERSQTFKDDKSQFERHRNYREHENRNSEDIQKTT